MAFLAKMKAAASEIDQRAEEDMEDEVPAPANPLQKLGVASWGKVQQVVHMNRMVRQLAKAASSQKARMYALRNTQPHTIIQRIKMLTQRKNAESWRNPEGDLDELCLLTSYICEFMRKQPYLVGMELCRAMHYEHLAPDKAVCKQGEFGDKFYIVLSGKVDVLVRCKETGQDDSITMLHRGSSFGDWALLNNERRTATCITRTPTEMLYIDKDAFVRVFRQTLLQMQNESERFLLKEVMMFHSVPSKHVRRFANHMWLTSHPEGKTFHLDTESRFYIVRAGTLEVLLPDVHGLAKKNSYTALVRSGEDTSQEGMKAGADGGPGGGKRKGKVLLAGGSLAKGTYFCGARMLGQFADISGLGARPGEPLKGWVVKATSPVELYIVHKTDFAETCGADLLQRLMEELAFRLYYYSGRLGMRSRPQSQASPYDELGATMDSGPSPFGPGRSVERQNKVANIIAQYQALNKSSPGAGGAAGAEIHTVPGMEEKKSRSRMGRTRLTSGLPPMGVVTSTERYWEAATVEAAHRAERYWKSFNSERAGRPASPTLLPAIHSEPSVGSVGTSPVRGGFSPSPVEGAHSPPRTRRGRPGASQEAAAGAAGGGRRPGASNELYTAHPSNEHADTIHGAGAGAGAGGGRARFRGPTGGDSDEDALGYASAAFISGRLSVPLVRQCFTYGEIQDSQDKTALFTEQQIRRLSHEYKGRGEHGRARSTTPTTGMRGRSETLPGMPPLSTLDEEEHLGQGRGRGGAGLKS